MKGNCDCNALNSNICPVCGTHGVWRAEKQEKISASKEPAILPELKKFAYSDELKMEITQLYGKATGGETRRSKPRKAIIVCSIVMVMKKHTIPFDVNHLKNELDVDEKTLNKMAKEISPNIGNVEFRITIKDHLMWLINSFGMKEEVLNELLKIYTVCTSRSAIFNSSKPETLAYGIVYYYLSQNLKEFNEDNFFNLSRISKDTIVHVAEEIKSKFNLTAM